MNSNHLKKFAKFEILVTPKIITFIYWIATILIVIGALTSLAQDSTQITLTMVVSLVMLRITFELIMVSFKNNEYLRKICEAVSKDETPKEPRFSSSAFDGASTDAWFGKDKSDS